MFRSGKTQEPGCPSGSGAQDGEHGSELKWGLAVTVEDKFAQATWAQ